MKKRYIKTVLKVLLSIIILLIILIAAALAYVKYSGDQSDNSDQSAPEPPARLVIKPPKISPKAKESAVVQSITSPVKRGSTASAAVKTNPKSKCTPALKYTDSNGNKIAYNNSSLKSKTADEFGLVSWDWPVSSSVPAGKWTLTVTCTYNKKSAVVIGDILVK